MHEALPFELEDYLELVDYTARITREDKRGAMGSAMPPILKRLQIKTEAWEKATSQFEGLFSQCVGSIEKIKEACELTQRQWANKQSVCQAIFSK